MGWMHIISAVVYFLVMLKMEVYIELYCMFLQIVMIYEIKIKLFKLHL